MISSYPTAAGTATITTVDCEKQVRSWRLLRSLVELLIPSCYCTFVEPTEPVQSKKPAVSSFNYHRPSSASNTSNITGTIFGYRKGKVNICIQTNPNSSTPLLLLELAVSTSTLAREMRGGILRIALESSNDDGIHENSSSSLLSMPIWTMYCNGKKVGFAVKRKPTKSDLQVLKQMESVSVGAGTVHGNNKEINREEDMMYLRGKFERVHGSCDSESFHLIDPEGSMGQQLSIFFLRSRSS
ncbi:PREDICTED: protein MIZU-KUSSEI 1 [Nicotiana attenuata]|uniref:Protein mizu-kussei 1 n=1 Tax=Nicotiana attenuata TaxID=49451 RepID=A0A1J6HSP8_NICAT|nr:PREDICTED: protein MIZU-KUSSEI 1 [Nicotiana attenuata]OIS95941.1 protein mizu-kussei 1 [Nicotiana attenuata]